jgi:hypothetical protein
MRSMKSEYIKLAYLNLCNYKTNMASYSNLKQIVVRTDGCTELLTDSPSLENIF